MTAISPATSRLSIRLRVLWACLLACAAFLALPAHAWAQDKIVASPEPPIVYVQSGNKATFQLSLKNNSGAEIKGVAVIDGSTVDSVTYTNRYDEPYHPKRFTYNMMSGKLVDAVGATYDGDEQGYTIAQGATATLTIEVNSYDEEVGTYTEYLQFGDFTGDWVFEGPDEEGLYTRYWDYEIDETYSARIPLTVVVYNPQNASLAFGTKPSEYSLDVTPIPTSIDFGTIDLATANEDTLSASTSYHVKNTSPLGNDEHGLSPDITVDLYLDKGSPYIDSPFTFSTGLSFGQTWSPLEPATPTQASFASCTLGFNATEYIAGTYTADLVLTSVPHGVKVNGRPIQGSGVYRYPLTIKLTGTNPRLSPRAVVTATPGNGLVELRFAAADGTESYEEYTIYRREGTDSQTNADKLDWSKYEKIGEASPDEDGNVLFVDGTTVNGKTYTYTVIKGFPYRAYASKPVSAKPQASNQSKLLKPDDVYASEAVGGVELSWEMNELYGGSDNNGVAMVDHFNVYRDNVLVAQVDQSAVNDQVEFDWVSDGGGNSHFGISGHTYGWSLFLETPQLYTNYTWQVAAVSKSGVEGYLSDEAQGYGVRDVPVILRHTADYDGRKMELEVFAEEYHTYSWSESIWWRAEGTQAPSTSGEPYARMTQDDEGIDNPIRLVDRNVTKGKVYTYTARVRDGEGRWSGAYTFTAKAEELDGVEDGYLAFAPVSVDWSVKKGTTACLEFVVGEASTCKVYRNGSPLKIYAPTGEGHVVSFENNPGIDGTYTYRVDRIISGVTVRGRDYTFVRNTTLVDESAFGQKPDAPTLTARTSGKNVILSWTPASTGGEVEGFYIYRKDAGEPRYGSYLATGYRWTGPYTYTDYWGNERYLKIQDASVRTLVDGQSGAYLGDASLGMLSSISWSEEGLPHEWYVTAYNSRGESAPSQVVRYDTASEDEYGNSKAPANDNDEYAPGAPTITNMWVEWKDDSSANYWYSLSGYVRVAWDDVPDSDIDQWQVAATGLDYTSSTPGKLEAWEAATNPNATKGDKEFSNAYVRSSYDIGSTVTMAVTATNTVGSATSEPAQVVVHSAPRFRALADNGSALLEWTDLDNDTQTQVSAWELWRKDAGGSWQLLQTLDAPLAYATTDKQNVSSYAWRDTGLTNGSTYQYRVVAKCTDDVDRPSVVREVTPLPNAATEAPGKVTNLNYNIAKGVVLFTWDPPTTGGAPEYYRLMRDPGDDSSAWTTEATLEAGANGATWTPSKAGTYTFFVYATNTVRGETAPAHYAWIDDVDFDTRYPNASSKLTVTVKAAQVAQQSSQLYGNSKLALTPGEGQVSLQWTADNGAAYYELERYNYDGSQTMPKATIVAEPGKKSFTYVDSTAEPGTRYRYLLTVCPSSGNRYVSEGYATALGATAADEAEAAAVQQQVDSLPAAASVTLDDKDAVEAARAAYDALSPEGQGLVDVAKLEAAEQVITAAQAEGQTAAQAAAAQGQINALPAADDVSLDDKDDVVAARAAYAELTPEAQALVDTTKLVAAEAALATLEADAVQGQINNLPAVANVTLDDKDAIEAARAAYEALSPEAQALVDTTGLVAAEQALAVAEAADEVQGQIDALPAASDVTLEDEDAIEAARAAYEALSPEAQALVDTTGLEDAEAALELLRGGDDPEPGDAVPVYRLYNHRTSEHLYTTNRGEYDALPGKTNGDWIQEGVAWLAPAEGAEGASPVWRLYNPVSGDHHYTSNEAERDALATRHGWRVEGTAFWTAAEGAPGTIGLYRLYNPRLQRGQHHYTKDAAERDGLVARHGWTFETVAFWGYEPE